jgi:hypothetical protein
MLKRINSDEITIMRFGDYYYDGNLLSPSEQLLPNQDKVRIDHDGISIYTKIGDECRYSWCNDEWEKLGFETFNRSYKSLFDEILRNEFSDSKFSIPLPRLTVEELNGVKRFEDFACIINNKEIWSKFGLEILKIANDKIDNRQQI